MKIFYDQNTAQFNSHNTAHNSYKFVWELDKLDGKQEEAKSEDEEGTKAKAKSVDDTSNGTSEKVETITWVKEQPRVNRMNGGDPWLD